MMKPIAGGRSAFDVSGVASLTEQEAKGILRSLNRSAAFGGMKPRQVVKYVEQQIEERRKFYRNMGQNPPEDAKEFAEFNKAQLARGK